MHWMIDIYIYELKYLTIITSPVKLIIIVFKFFKCSNLEYKLTKQNKNKQNLTRLKTNQNAAKLLLVTYKTLNNIIEI